MSGLIIKYKDLTGEYDTYLENEPWFPLVAEHAWNTETYEGTITLNEGVTELPDYYNGETCTYFNGYESITEIEFPEGLTAIRAESSVCFLNNLEKLIVPDTIEYLGNYFGCGNGVSEWENPTMDMVLPTGLKREYYENRPEALFDSTYEKTVTFNPTGEQYVKPFGYYAYFLQGTTFQIKDAIYINCAPEEFKDYDEIKSPRFSNVDQEHPITVYVAEEYYDMYDFDTFFDSLQREQIADIIKYNPSPEPPAKKTGFNLDNMQDKDYTIEIWDRTDRR